MATETVLSTDTLRQLIAKVGVRANAIREFSSDTLAEGGDMHAALDIISTLAENIGALCDAAVPHVVGSPLEWAGIKTRKEG